MSQKPESDLDVFARIKNDQIVELPVYRIHIKNRAHPMKWYRPVIDVIKPELQPFSRYNAAYTLTETCVYANYTVVPYTLEQMLSQISRQRNPKNEERPLITSIDAANINHIYGLVSNYATDKLNAFAKERQYDDIKSLAGYKDFVIPKLKAEGQRGFDLLQKTWTSLLAYFDGVSSGAIPVPTKIADIDALIPDLTWTSEN